MQAQYAKAAAKHCPVATLKLLDLCYYTDSVRFRVNRSLELAGTQVHTELKSSKESASTAPFHQTSVLDERTRARIIHGRFGLLLPPLTADSNPKNWGKMSRIRKKKLRNHTAKRLERELAAIVPYRHQPIRRIAMVAPC